MSEKRETQQEEALRRLKTVLGQNIRARREALGYTQEMLAFLADMSTAHLGNIERGSANNNPTLFTLLKISLSLRIAPGQLLNDASLPELQQPPDQPLPHPKNRR